MLNTLRTLWNDQDGASTTEYALVVSLVAITILVAVVSFGSAVNDSFVNATDVF